jgi:hypothetical protein
MEDEELDEAWLTVARVKALFGSSKEKQDELINFAQAPTYSHKEEMFQDMEEAELDEV